MGGLTAAEKADIALYLNFDMIGSPNYIRFIYDGDGPAPSDWPDRRARGRSRSSSRI